MISASAPATDLGSIAEPTSLSPDRHTTLTSRHSLAMSSSSSSAVEASRTISPCERSRPCRERRMFYAFVRPGRDTRRQASREEGRSPLDHHRGREPAANTERPRPRLSLPSERRGTSNGSCGHSSGSRIGSFAVRVMGRGEISEDRPSSAKQYHYGGSRPTSAGPHDLGGGYAGVGRRWPPDRCLFFGIAQLPLEPAFTFRLTEGDARHDQLPSLAGNLGTRFRMTLPGAGLPARLA